MLLRFPTSNGRLARCVLAITSSNRMALGAPSDRAMPVFASSTEHAIQGTGFARFEMRDEFLGPEPSYEPETEPKADKLSAASSESHGYDLLILVDISQ